MANMTQILEKKGSQVISINPRARVFDSAILMNDHKIGALVVIDQGRLMGIVTERDILRRVVAMQKDPADVLVEQIMTREVICCRPATEMDEARGMIMKRKIRHLPVVDDAGTVKGLISIGDLNAWDLDGQKRTIHYLHEYLYGSTV